MKMEWYYDSSSDIYLHWGNADDSLYLVRLTVNDDGTAELLFPSGNKKYFPSEDEASIWLGDEEFRDLDGLAQDFLDDGRPVDPRVAPPSANTEEGLCKKMIIPIPAEREGE